MTRMNPVKYAEDILGVHVPWQEIQDRLELHASSSELAAQKAIELRTLRSTLEDRKRHITAEAPSFSDWPDKVTPQKEYLKRLIDNDEEINRLERMIEDRQGDHDAAKSAARHHELGINALSARMTELGGLLHFYAEVKRAETISPVSSDKSNTTEG